ncbi:Calcium-dependent lipid-binding (CaLB domain) family protein [Thalictrum thalictroides]|uniref:Calcium-dependent lipid-binding (CaLB domain) family protein n=1 Tax=Thalictrum thalictroides TaxID=46969 RepID=A0A7J6VB49_THATH|nr:Calcium-dependent lipid-binding (CaLB domain) family protein [Thalictrum thalictroides]
MSSSSLRQQPPPTQSSAKLYDLDITIVSAKHLHNINWRQGNLIPVVAFWIEPGGRRFTTKPDQDGSTKPIWNERFIVPINGHITDSTLSIEITHSGNPKPIGSLLQFPLDSQSLLTESNPNLQTFQLLRPSGRPQGKIKVKLTLKERHQPPPPQQQQPPPQQHLPSPSPPLSDYHYTPHQSYYDNSAPPLPPPPRDYRIYSPHLPTYSPSSPYSSSYTDPYSGSGYYSGYYSQMQSLPPPPSRPSYDQGSSYGGHSVPSAPGSSYGGNSGPSAPVDYSNSYDQRVKGSKVGLGTGLAVGAAAGTLGALTLEEGVKHEEEKITERVQDDLDGRDVYGSYYR